MINNKNTLSVEIINIPILIVGTGIGGLSTAYYLTKYNLDYLIVTKNDSINASNTCIAPGNARIIEQEKVDDFVKFSLAQCGGIESNLRTIYQQSESIKEFYDDIGVAYENTSFGIIPVKFNNAKGGKIITNSLLKQINPPLSSMLLIHIEKKDNCFICDFYNHKKSNTIVRCVTQILIIASGGYGGNFLVNDNVSSITGECLILAKNIGAKLRGMSTVMLHPWGVNNGKNILVGEIVSLSQGKLVDKKGRQLLKDKLIIDAIKNNSYHEIFDILLKMEYDLFKSYSNIFLDFSSNDDEKTYKVLKYYGYSPSLLKDHKIIIQPTVHYTSGGIVVDEKSMAVNCENLYVVGEAQYNGNKGCGRLPGQAFTSAIICGKIIARNIKKESPYYITNNFNDLELPYLIHRFYSEKNISLEVIKEVDYELKKFFSEVILYKFDNHDLNKFDHKFYELKNFILHNLYGHGAILSKIISLFYRVDIIKEIYKDILYKSKK